MALKGIKRQNFFVKNVAKTSKQRRVLAGILLNGYFFLFFWAQ